MRKFYRLLQFSIAVMLSICSIVTHAQESVIRGLIKDERGSPVPGANVIIKGTTLGTTSDENGSFSIKCLHFRLKVFISRAFLFCRSFSVDDSANCMSSE